MPTVAIIGTRGYPSYYGGFETAVRKLAPDLVDAGWDVTVYGRSGSTKDDDPERDARVKTVRTRGLETKSVSTLSYGFTASLHALRTKPDVALVMNVANGYFLPLLRARGIRTVVNVDGIEWDRAKWGPLAKAMFKGGARMTARFGNVLVCDSHEIARRWKADYQRDGVFIPYGGDQTADLPVEPGLSHRGYVLVVARFVPENTIPEFLDAAAEIANHVPVVIVGSSGYGGDLEDRVRQLAEEHQQITWLGHISDDQRLLALWQHAAVYFHGHSVGGTNPTLVQAMAMATPIVARDTVYNREVLGVAGQFCAPDAASISRAVISLAKDPAAQESVSDLNLARARESYTWHGVNTKYEDTLRSVVTSTASGKTVTTGLIAFPMHGQHKLSNEGYRTRDGHLIEWFGRKLDNHGNVKVISRPEPWALAPLRRYRADQVAENTVPVKTLIGRLPSLRDRQRWWVDSLNSYHRGVSRVDAPVVTWNPFLALSSAWPMIVASRQPVAFDLLDDWTIHYAFAGVSDHVNEAYRRLFEHAHVVTANAEGTVELAHRFGRTDVEFLPNGCDPERFDPTSTAAGPLTVGYVGKIGKRLDLDLIVGAAANLPHVQFTFAGPVLDSEYRKPMEAQPNITMLGDVHYDDVPDLLRKFDVGWVPHRVGAGEVGGDVIKTYEYRAAGLPVLTTPVSGASSRGLDAVTVADAAHHTEWLSDQARAGARVSRVVSELPADVRWEGKADHILRRLDAGQASRA